MHTLPFLAAIAVRTIVVLTFITAGLRLFGKRHAGQMNIYDLALIMGLANAVQNAMTGGKGNLSIGIVSATSLLLVGWIASRTFLKRPTLETRLFGTPTVLIHEGHIEREHLRGEELTVDELHAAIRQSGLADPCDVKLAVLEVDGTISIVPKSSKK